MTEPFDLLIENGTIVDGSGADGFAGAVGIRDGRLSIVFGETDAEGAANRIDATGMVVAPGFIDLHSHSGLMIFADPLHEPKVRQGITTEVIGVDGLSYAPIPDPQDLEALAHMNAGLDGRPDISYDWGSVESYLDRLDELRPSVNLAFLVGNSALRMAAIGWDELEASEADVANMRSMLREAMEEGAIGLSSGLDYPPGAYASTDELAQLTREAASPRRLLPHACALRARRSVPRSVPRGDRDRPSRRGAGSHHPLLSPADLPRRAGTDAGSRRRRARGGPRRHVRHLPLRVGQHAAADHDPAMGAGGRPDGHQGAPRRSGGSRPHSARARRSAASSTRAATPGTTSGSGRSRDRSFCAGRADTLGELVRDRNGDSVDVLCDLLLEEDLRVNQVTPGPWTETLRDFIRHPVGMIGTDSTFVGAKPSPRTYGSFPRVLGQFVREEALLSVEEAVRSMTSAAAERLGLRDRGLLRDGFVADVVVFDPERVRSNATYDEPRQFPDGIEWVVVGGDVVVENGGRHTGARSGRVLRRRR